MKNRKIIPAVLLAALVLFAGIAWIIAKSPSEEIISPAEITMERILAANHPSALLTSANNFLLSFDGKEKYQCFVDDGVVLKEDAANDKSSLVVDRKYVVNRQGEEYNTVAVSESTFQDSWYADLVLNTALLLKESIVSVAEENGNFIVTTSLSGEDYDTHYNRAVRSTASCTTVYTLDKSSCKVKSVTQTATGTDDTTTVSTLTVAENVETPAAVSVMTSNSDLTALKNTKTSDYTLNVRKAEEGETEEINILFIGNSYSCYWTDELYFLLKEAGYDKDENGNAVTLNVCNLYRSGADFFNHWEDYERGISNYSFYTVYNGTYDPNSTTNKKIPHDPNARVNQDGFGLLKVLNEKDWDVIAFQQGNNHAGSETGHRNAIKKHFPMLYDLVTSYHPNARYFWQQNWAHEIGASSYKTEKKQLDATRVYRDVGLETCREYDLINAPLGDAWEIVGHDSTFFAFPEGGSAGTADPAYSLHSRLWAHNKGKTKVNFGKVVETDLSHDGDVGGGQYLNACVWFEMLTRTKIEESKAKDYIPTYSVGKAEQMAEGAYYIGLRAHFGEHRRVADLESVKNIVTDAQAKLQHAAHTAVLASYGEEFFIK
ncbi:MAG: DUF4886 domain-containing protein [Clostridia bacterium]|nr:DUF4886 domain-containing protein [Clostridia bacterium]